MPPARDPGASPAGAEGGASASLLDHPALGRLFFPQHCWFEAPFLVEAAGARLACSLHRAERSSLTVIHFHGNGEVVADHRDGFPARFTALGYDLLLAEYRGYGMSTGAARLGPMLDDVERLVAACDAPPERLVLFGRSIGSLFALEGVARFPRIAGLILESAIADPLERILLRVSPAEVGATPEAFAAAVRTRLDHREKLAAYRGPVLLLHALLDELVDVSNAERLASWSAGPATLKLFDRGNHQTIQSANAPDYFAAVAEFLSRVGSRAA